MTRTAHTAHNACARAWLLFDRSVCSVVTACVADSDDPDAEWPLWCSPVDDRGLGFQHCADPGYGDRVERVFKEYARLEWFWHSNRCRVSP